MRKPLISWSENTYRPWTPLWIVQETLLCLKEKRLPKSCLVQKKIFPWWYYRLRSTIRTTQKIKIGFGPIVEPEYTIGVRKSRIDPIVDAINQQSTNYAAGIFLHPQEMRQFDVVVIVKEFNPAYYPIIREMHKNGAKFLFDIVDNPFCTDPESLSYHDQPEFLQLVDGLIASSPVQIEDVKEFNKHVVLIEHPVINFATSGYPQKNTVDIIWQGYFANAPWMFRLHELLKKVREDSGQNVRMIYHANCRNREEGMIRYVKWYIRDWQQQLAQADIGIVIKPQEDDIQRRKPSNKIISYMAAGLPVVCTPTESDKLVIEHGKTGFFAYNDDDWYKYLKQLVENPQLRESIGRAGHNYVLTHFSIEQITQKYLKFIEQLKK